MIRTSIIAILAAAALAGGEAGPDRPGSNGNRPMGPSPEELFQKADADKDGKVTLAELTAALEGRMKAERASMFERMDANHDGNVSKEEFLAFEPPAPPGEDGQKKRRAGPDPEEMFKRMDRNGDGAITQDELPRKQAKDHFEDADANGDGVLSKEEIQAARAKMQERAGKDRPEGRERPEGKSER
ncbi:MAG: EF-hand domain-containing protein [Planctomycetes bacterium]|nr:EF-hand domain-containing protein [Planctomycetota bacterium]